MFFRAHNNLLKILGYFRNLGISFITILRYFISDVTALEIYLQHATKFPKAYIPFLFTPVLGNLMKVNIASCNLFYTTNWPRLSDPYKKDDSIPDM